MSDKKPEITRIWRKEPFFHPEAGWNLLFLAIILISSHYVWKWVGAGVHEAFIALGVYS